jgi:hypothetical protein
MDFEADIEAADEGGGDKPDGYESDCDSDYEDAEEATGAGSGQG